MSAFEILVSGAFAGLVLLAGVRLLLWHDLWGLPVLLLAGAILYLVKRLESRAAIEQADIESKSPPVVQAMLDQSIDTMTNAARLSGALAGAIHKLDQAYTDLDRRPAPATSWLESIPAEYRELPPPRPEI
jgi:hypothetical protein